MKEKNDIEGLSDTDIWLKISITVRLNSFSNNGEIWRLVTMWIPWEGVFSFLKHLYN